QAEGKQVEIRIEGLDTRADRQALQGLKDPVMHLLRNAIGHGIEPPQSRARRGKSPTGRIDFALTRQGNHLVLRVEDDGAGLDRDRIADEAARRGLLPPGEAAPSTPEALTRLLLLPGFTTTRVVTEIAGRGIGLAVVDKAVRQLQGSFVLAPAEPSGTVATITVPLVVAGHRLLLMKSGEHSYGIPAESVDRLYRFAPDDIMTVNGAMAVMPAGMREPVRLASLAGLLGAPDGAVAGRDGKTLAVAIKAAGASLYVAVDSCSAVQDAVIHDLDAAVPGIALVMGGIVQADGSVVTVLNPAALIAASARTPQAHAMPLQPAPERESRPLILVVDDSITTRTLEKSILESHGFRVRLSVDGVDALEQLDRERPDLVIVDIEMPRMDGFELLHAMKGDRRIADIPVVLVTSRDDASDRRKGLALGAEAYIVKQRFDQRALLETIEQIL
ncbi:MAG TPA: response regulator, partial [Steroidobacteraceae bacterium]